MHFILASKPIEINPCYPNPCGINAKCSDGICTCLPEYHGDPYDKCRPECVINEECPKNKACLQNKCVDPCIGICGENAICEVTNHIPICLCPAGMSGNPFTSCQVYQRN